MSRLTRARDRIAAFVGGRAAILVYHRVAELPVDPWQLAVSPARFESQARWLAHDRHVVPLREIVSRVRTGRSVRGLAAITFDDGYADNARIAQPILARLGLPATYFVTTSVLDGVTRFWWDELEEVLLRTGSLPSSFEPRDGDPSLAFSLGDDAHLDDDGRTAIAEWKADRPHPNRRTAAFLAIATVMRDLAPRRRREILDALRGWAGILPGASEAMSRAELVELARADGVEIGAHGVTHRTLAAIDPATRGAEIGTSKSTLEDVLHRRVDGFAYPNGVHDRTTVHAVASAGFSYAVTTSGDPVASSSHPFELGRVHVGDWEPERLARALRRALSRAPRAWLGSVSP